MGNCQIFWICIIIPFCLVFQNSEAGVQRSEEVKDHRPHARCLFSFWKTPEAVIETVEEMPQPPIPAVLPPPQTLYPSSVMPDPGTPVTSAFVTPEGCLSWWENGQQYVQCNPYPYTQQHVNPYPYRANQ